jgi:hypothetical protein
MTLGALSPQWRTSFLNPAPTTPQMPQNLLRPTVMNGLFGGLGRIAVRPDMVEKVIGPGPVMVGQANGNGNGVGISAGASVGWGLVAAASSAASAWHGYRRNNSVGWALWWALMGGMFPVITPVIGVAQGWGKRRRG